MSRADVLELTLWEMHDLVEEQERQRRQLNEAIKKAQEEAAAAKVAARSR